MEFERRKKYHAHINIAPLVDCVFLLLLFFMLTYQLVEERGIRVKLPLSKTAETEAEEVTITITQKEEVFIGKERVAVETLSEEIGKRLKRDQKRASVSIKADRRVSLGFLVKVVDEIRMAGITTFNVVTERR